jgi:RHS repeat-associated protein
MAPSLQQAVNSANNQIVGQTYDANGNQLTAPGVTGSLIYDVENRLVSAPGVQYAYDSQNKRVWSATLDSSGNLKSQTAYFYGVNGTKLEECTLTVSGANFYDPVTETDVYFAGRRVLINGNTNSEDQLGSNASVGNAFFPWGEARGLNPQDTWSFASYWRDSATQLDYANNRYYSNAYGRFMTPDPSWRSVNLKNPQTWNLYAYVVGDPVNGNDPSGLDSFDDGGDGVCPNIALAECGGFDPGVYNGMPIPPGASYPVSIPTSISYPINGGSGLTGSLNINLTNGGMSLQFADAQDGAIAIGACLAQPELCVMVGGAVLTIYVVTTYGPALWEAIQSQITSRQAAQNAGIKYDPYNVGRNKNGDCNPPDPSKFVKWKGSDPQHWHYITWNVTPDCEAYPDYKTGPDPGPEYTEIFPR